MEKEGSSYELSSAIVETKYHQWLQTRCIEGGGSVSFKDPEAPSTNSVPVLEEKKKKFVFEQQ